jgi:hypothetical protein
LQRVSGEPFLDLNVTEEFADQIALVQPFGHQDEIIDQSRRTLRRIPENQKEPNLLTSLAAQNTLLKFSLENGFNKARLMARCLLLAEA